MRLIAKVIRISHAKFHCNRLKLYKTFKIIRVSFLAHTVFPTSCNRPDLIPANSKATVVSMYLVGFDIEVCVIIASISFCKVRQHHRLGLVDIRCVNGRAAFSWCCFNCVPKIPTIYLNLLKLGMYKISWPLFSRHSVLSDADVSALITVSQFLTPE